MDWPRKLGVFLVAAGAVLFGAALVPSLYGAAMARLAVARFRAQNPTHRLWNGARVRAYQQTLALSFPPAEAVLRVPKVGIEAPVLEGTSTLTLNRGVGRIPGTALPGETGNLAITGHRDGFFRPLKDVSPGDIIDLDLPAAHSAPGQGGISAEGRPKTQTERYVVRSIRIVSPQDVSVLRPTAGATLTLVTCYPFYFVGPAPQRFIVQATRISPSSSTDPFPQTLRTN